MISTWPEAALVAMVEAFHPSQDLLLCSQSWFSTEYAQTRGVGRGRGRGRGAVQIVQRCPAVMFLMHLFSGPSITGESMQITNWVMNLCYQKPPQSSVAGSGREAAAESAIEMRSRDHIWTPRIPWHSANMDVLFWQQLAAGWWRHFAILDDMDKIDIVWWRWWWVKQKVSTT